VQLILYRHAVSINQDICADTISGDEDALVMATYGQIQEFCPENETIEAYLERVELYFEANTISARTSELQCSSVLLVGRTTLCCAIYWLHRS